MQNNLKVRIFIGPNGSGKSTLFYTLKHDYRLKMGVYVNADEVQKEFEKNDCYIIPKELSSVVKAEELKLFLKNHALNNRFDFTEYLENLDIVSSTIVLKSSKVNSYFAAIISDYLRIKLSENKISFSYETVYSDKSKIKFVNNLNKQGYRIYLYIISTIHPAINVMRIKSRAAAGGHEVSEEKIMERFEKSLQNIKRSIKYSDRSFIIDNSENELPTLCAEIINGNRIKYLNKTYQPTWVKNLIKHNGKK
jgi:predicted ABC-type ATPase